MRALLAILTTAGLLACGTHPVLAQATADAGPLERVAAIAREDPACRAAIANNRVRVTCPSKDDALEMAKLDAAKKRIKAIGGVAVFNPNCTTPVGGPDAGDRQCDLDVERRR